MQMYIYKYFKDNFNYQKSSNGFWKFLDIMMYPKNCYNNLTNIDDNEYYLYLWYRINPNIRTNIVYLNYIFKELNVELDKKQESPAVILNIFTLIVELLTEAGLLKTSTLEIEEEGNLFKDALECILYEVGVLPDKDGNDNSLGTIYELLKKSQTINLYMLKNSSLIRARIN